jgi:hypothetical protein
MPRALLTAGLLLVVGLGAAQTQQPPQPKSARPAPAAKSGQPASQPAALRHDAVLLVEDAFNLVRMLDEAEFLARREEMARNLLNNLLPFLAGAEKPRQVAVPPAPVLRSPAHAPAPSKPTTLRGAAGPAPAAKPPTSTPAGPAYARVPQKMRIKAKFQAAAAPFKKLMAENPQQAGRVGELLRAARAALAAQQFDAAESHLDRALQLLGVSSP